MDRQAKEKGAKRVPPCIPSNELSVLSPRNKKMLWSTECELVDAGSTNFSRFQHLVPMDRVESILEIQLLQGMVRLQLTEV